MMRSKKRLAMGGSVRVVVAAAVFMLVGGAFPGQATAATSPSTFGLLVSKLPSRAGALSLPGAQVGGKVAIFTSGPADLVSVSFYLDDPTMQSVPRRIERWTPFDFAGTAADGTAVMFDTSELTPGSHIVSAEGLSASGEPVETSATFTVITQTTSTPAVPATTSYSSTDSWTSAPVTSSVVTRAPVTSSVVTRAPVTSSVVTRAPVTSSVPTPASTPAVPSTTDAAPLIAGAGGCLVSHPTVSCVGAPGGLALAGLGSGGYTVAQAGAVLDGVHIAGDLLVAANNVVIKNSQIDGTLINEVGGSHFSFTVSDTTVGPASGCITAPGVGEAQFTATRVLVRGHDDGFRMSGDNVRVQDSYARLCANSGSHADGIQSYCPDTACTGLVFDHNTIDARNVDATFMINLNDPNVGGVSVTDNLLAGGAYTIVTKWHSGSTWTVANNRVVDGAWAYGPASGEGTCGSQDWAGNTIVTIDTNYNITSTVEQLPCIP